MSSDFNNELMRKKSKKEIYDRLMTEDYTKVENLWNIVLAMHASNCELERRVHDLEVELERTRDHVASISLGRRPQ